MTIAQLEIAPQVVIIGFTVIFCVLGVLVILLAVMAGKGFILQGNEEKKPTSEDSV